MTGLLDRMKASTPGENERRRFGVWALIALIVLLPLWWLWGAGVAAAVLRLPAAMVAGLFGLPGQISADPEGGWKIATGLAQIGGGDFILTVSSGELRRFLLSFPFFAALMIAPPRSGRLWLAAVIGGVVLSFGFVVSVSVFAWGTLAPMLNPALAMNPSEPSILASAPLNPALAQAAVIGRYVTFTITPLFTALVLWGCLNPRGRLALLGEFSGSDDGASRGDATPG